MESKNAAGWFSASAMWLAVGALSLCAGLPISLGVGGLTVAAGAVALEAAGLAPTTSALGTAALVGLAGAVAAGFVGFASGVVRGLRGEPAEARGAFLSRRPFLSLSLGSTLASGAVALLGRAGSSETADALVVVGAPALVVAAVGAARLAWKAWMAGAAVVARFGRVSTFRALSVAATSSALSLVLVASAAPVEATRGLGRASPVFQAPEPSGRWGTEGPLLGGTLALPFPRGAGDSTSPEVRRFEDCAEQLAPEQDGALGGAFLEARQLGERRLGRQDAWDLAMTTLIGVCEEYQSKHIDELKPYYFRSLRNAFGKSWRSARYESRFAELEGPDTSPGEPSALDNLIWARNRQCMREAMRFLSETDREVLDAAAKHDSPSLVAKQLGVGYATANKRYHRAIRRLKSEIRMRCP